MLEAFDSAGSMTTERVKETPADWTPYSAPRAHVPEHAETPRERPVRHAPPDGGQLGRRRELRFLAQENRLWLQWWEDGEYLGRTARLVNVSRGGAMIIAWFLLREGQRLRVFLEEAESQNGVEATVLGVVPGITAMHQIRLSFTTPCPPCFFDAVSKDFEAWLDSRPGAT